MRTIVKGKRFEVPERDRLYAERKLQRLDRLLDDRSDAILELSVEHHRSAADSYIVDLTLVVAGQTIRGTAAASTHRAGIDEVLDKVERRAVDFREKPRARRPAEHAAAGSAATRPSTATRPNAATRPSAATAASDRAQDRDADASRVTKVKRFAIEPMFEEDAVARMEELGHAFFVFVDAETERIAVLYRRRDGGYGLIEPVIGGGYTSGGPSRGGSSRSGSPRDESPGGEPKRGGTARR